MNKKEKVNKSEKLTLDKTHESLCNEWHPTKNTLRPSDVTAGSNKMVWWLLPYDDPKTGKHFDFEWRATVKNRSHGEMCPFLSGRAILIGFNDLGSVNLNLAKWWHPTRNGSLTPRDVTANSHKKVWWFLPYDDPETGKHFDFEWEAKIDNMNKRGGCPYLSGQAVWPGFNDLESINPALAKEFHPTKNGKLTPQSVTASSNQKVWWLLPYDDPKTGKHFDFEWQAAIGNRNLGATCPYLSGHAVWPGFNDLASVNPDLAKEFHPTKNGKLTPQNITASSNQKIWWLLPYDDPRTGKHFDFEWQARVADRNKGKGCPYLVNSALWPGYNDLETVLPNLSKEWDYEKNKNLTPRDILYGSHQLVWWKCKKGHSWKASADHRYRLGNGCPHCVKELRTSFPEQVIYYYVKSVFDDAVSGDRETLDLELDVYIPSIKVGIEYDGQAWHKDIDRDLKKNQKCKDSGISLIRIREDGCPTMVDDSCTLLMVAAGDTNALCEAISEMGRLLNVTINADIGRDYTEILNLLEYTKKKNSLRKLFPNVAREWHKSKNGNLTPDCVAAYSRKVVWWGLDYEDPKTGNKLYLEWPAAISDRTAKGHGCPYLSGHKIHPLLNSLSALNGKLAKEWNYERNKGLVNKKGEDLSTPDKISPGSHSEVWWKCSICGHEWQAKVENRHRLGQGCPECYKNSRKRKTISQSDLDLSSD